MTTNFAISSVIAELTRSISDPPVSGQLGSGTTEPIESERIATAATAAITTPIIFRPSLLGTRPPDHTALMGIVVPLAAGVLGSVTVRSPFLNAAVTLLPSTPTGSRTLRVKAP